MSGARNNPWQPVPDLDGAMAATTISSAEDEAHQVNDKAKDLCHVEWPQLPATTTPTTSPVKSQKLTPSIGTRRRNGSVLDRKEGCGEASGAGVVWGARPQTQLNGDEFSPKDGGKAAGRDKVTNGQVVEQSVGNDGDEKEGGCGKGKQVKKDHEDRVPMNGQEQLPSKAEDAITTEEASTRTDTNRHGDSTKNGDRGLSTIEKEEPRVSIVGNCSIFNKSAASTTTTEQKERPLDINKGTKTGTQSYVSDEVTKKTEGNDDNREEAPYWKIQPTKSDQDAAEAQQNNQSTDADEDETATPRLQTYINLHNDMMHHQTAPASSPSQRESDASRAAHIARLLLSNHAINGDLPLVMNAHACLVIGCSDADDCYEKMQEAEMLGVCRTVMGVLEREAEGEDADYYEYDDDDDDEDEEDDADADVKGEDEDEGGEVYTLP
ncbi:hypothetical protein Q7P37_005992 [Cladosporium fusiforme]